MKGAASIGIPAHDYNQNVDNDININNDINSDNINNITDNNINDNNDYMIRILNQASQSRVFASACSRGS